MHFKQHAFKNTIEITSTNNYHITVSPLAYQKMAVYVDNVSNEVGWLGTCFDLGNGAFHIGDVYLPTQEVSAVQTEISTEAMGSLIIELLQEPDGTNIVNNLRFWGHSHVNFETSPSLQDNEQMDKFIQPETKYFLRGICNKHGKMQFSLFLYHQGIVIHDIPWSLSLDVVIDVNAIQQQITDRVTVTPIVYGSQYGYYGSRHDHNRWGSSDQYRRSGFDQQITGEDLDEWERQQLTKFHPLGELDD